ncbi:5-formyltetrahydrofolate cyclo-ligase [Acetobacter sp. AN02]|uniref:5-formyltetrahydrofolate cyclo-ligase n=1 Tax=Acetobacter sp. AN02 TaxID=2894186 RepID=UPI0024344845|nr:5-formyltetrahydrofolate cyclo-ligase [Acetobacter sp. AN02]MDG6093786.1 5-formyltetrahydrofolate cyclo-ligase [Acetobacter sp. AN02]
MTDIRAEKSTLRRCWREKRLAGSDPAALAGLEEALLSHILRSGAQTIASLWPLPGEPDLRALNRSLHEAGRNVLLPETPPRGEALEFRLWAPQARMIEGRFGTFHPDGPVMSPDLILVPMLAFDRKGHRLGYGGGYYDRTLTAFPNAILVGFAFSFQEAKALPVEPWDIPLPLIITERGALHTSGA